LAVHGYESRSGHLPHGATWHTDSDGWLAQIAPDSEQRVGPKNPLVVCPTRRGPTPSRWLPHDLTDYASAQPGPVQEGYYNAVTGGPGPGPVGGYAGLIIRRGFGRVPLADCSRGTSNTVLAAEKWAYQPHYTVGPAHDDAAWFGGWDWDQTRCTYLPPRPDRDWGHYEAFGSAHLGGLNAVYGDGSVRWVAYGVDPALWHESGRR
jgi:prepilin-type processing-associated H-X9-DG protein